MPKRMRLSFNVSDAPLVVRCFGLRVVDGKLKKPSSLDYIAARCGICKEIIKTPEDVGGFFDENSIPLVCCNSTRCLQKVTEKYEK